MSKRDINLYRKENPIMDFAIDQSFYQKAKAMLDKIDQNQKLQQLASANGIDVKNSTQLNEATKNNIATSVIALMLAKQSNDPRYADLVRCGMDHRKTKIEIINDYKDQANQIISRAKNTDFNNLSGFAETHLADPAENGEIIQEGLIGAILAIPIVIAGGVVFVAGLLVFIVIKLIIQAISFVIKSIYRLIRKLTAATPDKILKRLEKLTPDERVKFRIKTKNTYDYSEYEYKTDDKLNDSFFGFKAVSDLIIEYAKLIDKTIKMGTDPSESEFDGNLSEWSDLKDKVKQYEKIFKYRKKNSKDYIKEETELLGIFDDVFMEADENYADQIENDFDDAINDITNDAHDVETVGSDEYIVYNYEQTVNLLKSMKKFNLLEKIKKLNNDLKDGIKQLKKLEERSQMTYDPDNTSGVEIIDKMYNFVNKNNLKLRDSGIKYCSSIISRSAIYITYDMTSFLDAVVKQGIKNVKSGNTSSTSSTTHSDDDIDKDNVEMLSDDQVEVLGSEFDENNPKHEDEPED